MISKGEQSSSISRTTHVSQPVRRAAREAGFPASVTEPVTKTLFCEWRAPLGDEVDEIASLRRLQDTLEFRDDRDIRLDRLPTPVLLLGEDEHSIAAHLPAEADNIPTPLAFVEAAPTLDEPWSPPRNVARTARSHQLTKCGVPRHRTGAADIARPIALHQVSEFLLAEIQYGADGPYARVPGFEV